LTKSAQKRVLTDCKIDTVNNDGQITVKNGGSIPSNRARTTVKIDTLLERNRKENREATPLPSPAKRQAKALKENPPSGEVSPKAEAAMLNGV